ncbi:hypothetical protein ACRZ5S_19860 [Vibrio scophthalmi]|uniref:hypothetical protein n=1 Tax=Vibrio scophthalmi TaxID=45658 RepID=UPI003EBE1854
MKRRKIQIDNGFGVEDKIVSEIKLDDNKDYDKMNFDSFEDFQRKLERLIAKMSILLIIPMSIIYFDMFPKMHKTIHQEVTYDTLQSEVYDLESEYSKYHPLIDKITIDKMVTDEEFDALVSTMNNDENLNLITKLVIFEIIKKSESSEYVKNHIEKTIKIIEGDNDDE